MNQVIFGLHSVEAILEKQPERILRVHLQNKGAQDKRLQKIIATLTEYKITYHPVPRETLDRLAQHGNHQGIVVECRPMRAQTESDLKALLEKVKMPLLLILDGVQDPHNLGACFRSADAAGVHAIIAPKDKAVGITPVVSKVASGAAETIPFVQVTNLARTLENLKEQGIWIYGAAAEATQTIYQTDLKGPLALVLGAEGSGLRRLTRERCDALVNIPMFGTVESLNVSVATGIMLFEAVRQRLK
jgi:23S rRNA (guanosine2251-2'-O)-methyltransferase